MAHAPPAGNAKPQTQIIKTAHVRAAEHIRNIYSTFRVRASNNCGQTNRAHRTISFWPHYFPVL